MRRYQIVPNPACRADASSQANLRAPPSGPPGKAHLRAGLGSALLAILTLPFTGCGEISAREADELLYLNSRILANIEARLDTIEKLAPGDRHGQGDGDYVYGEASDPLEADGSGWESGRVAVTGEGTVRQQGSMQFYALDLDYQDVALRGTTLDGPVAATVGVTLFDGEIAVTYTFDGEIEALGEVEGAADMAWSMSADSMTGGMPRYQGTVNGREIGDKR